MKYFCSSSKKYSKIGLILSISIESIQSEHTYFLIKYIFIFSF